MTVPLLKALHLAALVMWLGPTTAGYLAVRRADAARRAGRPLPRDHEIWVWRGFETLLRVEHVAFVALLLTGLGLLASYGLGPLDLIAGGPLWLRAKLALVLAVLVPLEAHDVFLSHVTLPRVLSRLEAGHGDPAADLAPHRRLLSRGVVLFAALVPLLFYLVAFRPGAF